MEQIKDRVVKLLYHELETPVTFEQLVLKLKLSVEDEAMLREVLDELMGQGDVIETKKKRYAAPEKLGYVKGVYRGHEKGFGFVIPDDGSTDLFIAADADGSVMNGDKVLARVLTQKETGRKREGEIAKIIERGVKRIVGRLEVSDRGGYVVPDDKRMQWDVFIPFNALGGAAENQKVVAEITVYPKRGRNPEGRILEILGDAEAIGVDILSIIRRHELREDFPENVLHEAEKVSETVSDEEIKTRRDLRGECIITIDGEDAKDLDDAVSLKTLPNGNRLLGVHIADVSHYVREGSALDKEAFIRGTSVYLVDRVIPMLPKRLSNGICSLNPNVDRLTLSVEMEIDSFGNVVRHEIFNGVIKTTHRMTYTNVTKLLEAPTPELLETYGDILPMLQDMRELAILLKQKRKGKGSIDFDFPEAKILLDSEGHPTEIVKREITISNEIIEQFMLLTNETVAEDMYWRGVPFVYRVHEKPDEEKIKNFALLANHLGYSFKPARTSHPKQFQQILKAAKGQPEERVIHTVLLRAMMKARYDRENLGHFALASKYYCHFTSPIRRYPDLMIHRIIKEVLSGGLSDKRSASLEKAAIKAAVQASECEIKAQEAERETDDLKKVEFMQDKVGETFEGVVSGITAFGMFVELENTVEGLVRVSSMDDDYYVFDELHYRLVGERKHHIYGIGDTVTVQMVSADKEARRIEFVLKGMKKHRKPPEPPKAKKRNKPSGTGKNMKTRSRKKYRSRKK